MPLSDLLKHYPLLINLAVVLQLLIFIVYLAMLDDSPKQSRWPLMVVLSLFLCGKFDDLLQQTQAIALYPNLAFYGSTVSLLMGPAILWYIRARAHVLKSLQKHHLWHLTIVLLPVTYLWFSWWRYSADSKLALMQSGEFANAITLLVLPAYSDAIILVYLLLSLVLLKEHGLKIRHWFSNTVPLEMRGLRTLLSLFAMMLLLHIAWVLVRGHWLDKSLSFVFMSVLVSFHLILINTLVIEFLKQNPFISDYQADAETNEPNPGDSMSEEVKNQYQQIIKKLDVSLNRKALHLDPDLTIVQLAKSIGVHHREVSRAINLISEQNFYEYINERRITHAKTLLQSSSNVPILEAAYESGFNSKSTFNQSFKKFTGQTPSTFRKACQTNHRS